MPPDAIGSGDSFRFDWGGDAIAAVELVSMARENGWLLTLASLAEHHTLANMANAMQPSPTYGARTAPMSPQGLATTKCQLKTRAAPSSLLLAPIRPNCTQANAVDPGQPSQDLLRSHPANSFEKSPSPGHCRA
jgi:hypothetical protein